MNEAFSTLFAQLSSIEYRLDPYPDDVVEEDSLPPDYEIVKASCRHDLESCFSLAKLIIKELEADCEAEITAFNESH